MVYQLSLEMIGAITISSPPEGNKNIFRNDKLALVLQRLEEEEVHNAEEKEQMIMRYGEFATMIQKQEEEKVK